MKTLMLCFASLMACASLAFAASGPLLVPDYDRDGAIGPTDYDRLNAGEQFTIWLNDDDDAEGAEADDGNGDTNSDLHDVPGGEDNDRDCEDDTVNGRCDLLDFFPVLIEVNGVDDWSNYDWKLCGASVNVVFTQLVAYKAGDFHTKEAKSFVDDEMPLYEAPVVQLADEDEVALPDGFLKNGRGVIIVEGAALGDKGLTLRGVRKGSDPVEVTLNLRVKNVEEMYGGMNLRPQAAVSSKPPYQIPAVSQSDNRHFVLVHGYNTNHEEARGNAAEFYKKLWQSGFDGMFTAVEWRGDQSQMELFWTTFTPNYYVNVENAFAAAKPFADACAKLPGEKILVGHSLGNLVVSSAIKDHGLDYTKYVMLNAAAKCAAFASDGRFANLPRTVNYYSPSDEFFADSNDIRVPQEDESDGRAVNRAFERAIARGGFWTFNERLPGRPTLVSTLNGVLTNLYDVEEKDAIRDEQLACALPGELVAAGANEVATLENVNLESFIGENPDWPVGEEVEGESGGGEWKNEWRHSTFREAAFYHTSKLYASLAAVGKPRIILDTDLGSSMDDLFTVDLAARMHKAGKLDLLAVMMNRPDKSDPEGKGEFLKFADRYLASLGLGDLPIGKSMPLAEERPPQTVFNPYWTLIYSNNVTGVGALMPTNRTDEQLGALANAVVLYRRLLNDAPDKSVVICSTGFLQNLKALMESGQNYDEDGIAANGMELIAAKVKELRIMAGCFDYTTSPDGLNGAEYNAAGDPVAAKTVMEQWPSPVVVSPWEVGLKLEYKPEDVLADFPAGTFDPVLRAAYLYWPEPIREGDMNRLWDPMTVLPLTEGETLLPLSEMGGIAVDEKGRTTFTPNASSNRCYQVASNMNVGAVMNRIRAICQTGNPSVSMRVSGQPEPGVDYNGSELVFKFENIQCGSYAEDDLKFEFTVDDEKGEQMFQPDGTEWNDKLGVLSVRFSIPPDAVTAGNIYTGKLEVAMANDALGTNLLVTASRQLVQGEMVDSEEEWLYAYLSETPINYVPETEMPEGVAVKMTTTASFTGEPFEEQYLSAAGAVQTAVRIVGDGADGYKFQFYAFAVDEEENLHKGWWDCNVSNVVPVAEENYEITAELMYSVDAQRQLHTVAFFAKDASDNQPARPVFLGNMIDDDGGVGNAGRLGSVSLTEPGTEIILSGILLNKLNANLARIGDDEEYATVAEAVAAEYGMPIRLLHAASWKPTAEDIGKPVRFLNKSWLVLDLSELPANARVVWTDEDGDNGTLSLELAFADTVVYGTIRTAEEGSPVAEAIAVKDGKYVYVGDEAGVAPFVKDGVTKVVDHRGQGMVMPGCTDGHSHYTMHYGLENMKGGVMFASGDDKTAVLEKLKAAAAAAKAAGKKSLFGFGWDMVTLVAGEDDPPTLAELDEATNGEGGEKISMVILDSGGHHAFCNSECLKRCGIIDGKGGVLVKKIPGGYLELDENGYPTGYAEERAMGYLMRMGGIDYDELMDDEVAKISIRKTRDLLLSTGYTAALEGWSNILHSNKLYAAAKHLDANGELNLVFPMTYEVEPWMSDAEMSNQIDYLDALNEMYATDHVQPKYLKIFMDGVVETKTGAMLMPYKDDHEYYRSFWSTNRLADITRACNAKNLTVHVHTMGDAAIRDTVTAYIMGGDGTHRNCLVHLRNVSTNDVNDFERMAANNIACSAGFTWHVSATEKEDALLELFLEKDYIAHAYPIKSFFDAGVKVSSHSDFPANKPCPQDPFGIMQVAVTGLPPDPPAGLKPHDTNELVTIEQAFQALTLNGAWQLGLEKERGSIKVGKWADFVLADQDVFTCEKTKIHEAKVVSTWFEGEKVYQASEFVPVTPGKALGPYDTAEEASNVLARAEFAPSAEVAERLGGEGSQALKAYCDMFMLDVVPTADDKWEVAAFLTPPEWTNVVESARSATRQIPVADIAALELGEVLEDVPLTNCVPGFYYSLYDGVSVTNLKANVNAANCNILCGPNTTVVIPVLPKPSLASGFFSIGVLESPAVMAGGGP